MTSIGAALPQKPRPNPTEDNVSHPFFDAQSIQRPINIFTLCDAVCMIAPAITTTAPKNRVCLRPKPSEKYGVKGKEAREPIC